MGTSAVACGGDPLEPDPGVGPEVQLARATTVGRAYYPVGNWPQGGQGQPISGVACIITNPPPAYHVHAHVSLFVNGEQIAIPAGIGVVNPIVTNNYVNFDVTKCFYEVHTHDATGVVHLHANGGNNRALTLGQVFDVWGQPLTRDNVAGQRGRVIVYVDQARYEGDIKSIVLNANTLVSIQVGSPLVAPPKFIIPANP
ncbi:MAG: hypothetical protein M3O61_08250 [Gemmatimonadota bacterium]|nr:hypothetical protein [Gemmatimonadota bacterium]